MTVDNKLRFSRLAIPIAALLSGASIVPSATGQDHTKPPAVVTRYCSGCHGVKGQSELPYIPKLAGLSSGYLEQKLTRFSDAAVAPVDEPFFRLLKVSAEPTFSASASAHMIGTANAISAQDRKAAADWYACQSPAPGKVANPKGVVHGKALYEKGEQANKLPACHSCHGAEAEGTPGAPRLAGQNAAYLLSQLNHFRSGKQDSPMTEVARALNADQAQALAAYLQSR